MCFCGSQILAPGSCAFKSSQHFWLLKSVALFSVSTGNFVVINLSGIMLFYWGYLKYMDNSLNETLINVVCQLQRPGWDEKITWGMN
jgi:hypothetical protein